VKRLIRLKVYFDRARSYVSYVQTGVVVLTAVKVFGITPPLWSFPLWLSLFVAICIFIGWLDSKLKIYDAEQKRISEQNPILIDIWEAVRKK
jgi:hypothetical protein